MDNIFLVREIIDICKYYDVNCGIVPLDQEKALTGWITLMFSTHRAFGIVDTFLAWVDLLYNGAH